VLCHEEHAKECFSQDGWKTGLHLALLGTIACTELQIQKSFGADACMSFSSAISAWYFTGWE
jgi:hypothetical protein